MATVIRRLCDVDHAHGDASEYRLAINAREVSLDLCADCGGRLTEGLAPYLQMGRVIRAGKVATGTRSDGTPSVMPRTPCPVCKNSIGNQGLGTHVAKHISNGEYTQAAWNEFRHSLVTAAVKAKPESKAPAKPAKKAAPAKASAAKR